MTIAISIAVILLILGYFYLKCSVMGSLSTLMILIIATVLTFSYYEKLAELFVSRGYGVQWAHMGCFVLIFVLSFALLRALRDLLVGGAVIDLGQPIKVGTAVVCGLAAGIIISGNLFVAMGLVPIQSKFLHSRFNPNSPVILKNPRTTFLNTDGFVAGLYGFISRGSLSGGKSFAVLHAEYLSQIHLNRIKTGEGVLAVTSKKSLVLPSGSAKKPVRLWEAPEKGKVTVVRMGIVAQNIQSGGAINPDSPGRIQFFPAQVRMICKLPSEMGDPLAGTGKAVWPSGFYENGQLAEAKLDEVKSYDIKTAKDRVIWLDMVFEVPDGHEGVLLQFKQDAVVKLPKPVPLTEESEKILSGEEEAEE